MDLREYYSDMRKIESELDSRHPDGVVHVTSLFHREKNSTAGTTSSASTRNAARVLTDQTHRESTPKEVEAFLSRQERDRVRNAKSEQLKKQQYVLVVDRDQPAEAPVIGSAEAVTRGDDKVSVKYDS